jgi:hypothetical protein
MTPYEIEVMLHYNCIAIDHPDIHKNPPVWRPTVNSMLDKGMLKRTDVGNADTAYQITEKGRAYVDHLCLVDIPICKWVQPA